MKRFLSAVALCVSLLLFGLFVFLPTTKAEKSLLETLLSLPAPPPPNPLVVVRRVNNANLAFDKDKPPADDVPIDDLVNYWQNINNYNQKFTYTPDPSDRTVERLIEEVENNPEKLPSLLGAFAGKPGAVETVKRLYDREMSDKKYEREWRDSIKRWLTYNSGYFSDELAKIAGQASDTNEYVSNQDEVLSLARVDWEKARPILQRMLADNTQPISQTLARWAFYQHAMREKDSIEADRYRKELQATVENKSNKPGNRDLAMDALVESGDFEGRDEWYYSLLEDETLHDLRVNGTSYTGLTTLLNHSPSDKYVAKMIELSRSGSAAVRSAAVRNLSTLLDDKHPEVLEALLPWLENPKWAKETNGERRQLVSALRQFAIPESVPGLIAILNEKETRETPEYVGNMAMNVNMSRPTGGTIKVDSYPYRDEAIGALAMQKDFRAAGALRMVLSQVEDWQRGAVVQAILVSRGFSIPEQIEALELVARNYGQQSEEMIGNSSTNSVSVSVDSTPAMRLMNSNLMGNTYEIPNRPFNPLEIKPILGTQLINQPDADEELVTALIDRIGFLDKKDPVLALGLRRIMQNWNGAAVNRLMLQDLKNNRIEADSVVKLLSLRKELREKQWNDVNDARAGSPTALGIGACLIENNNEYDAILASENIEAKAAMLTCARLLRAQLPVPMVAANLKSPNKILATAAERYLISEDSPEARQIVLALHPNEALVLGARTYFGTEDSSTTNSAYLPQLFATVNESMTTASYYIYSGYDEKLATAEKKLRKEVKENQELLGVYAYADNYVRIYKDKAVFSWQEDKARYRERVLEKSEFDNLKEYLAAENVNELPPFLAECEGDCEGRELLMLGRQGGRRVFTFGDPKPKFFADLEGIFEGMRQPPAKLHYWLEKGVSGLEILFEDENLQAEAVWKTGDDFRVLINNQARRKEIDNEIERLEQAEDERLSETESEEVYDKYEKIEQERRKRREQREYENYTWNKFAGNALAGITEQPNNIEFLPKLDGAAIRAGTQQWKARAGAFEIRSDSEGLYKISSGRVTKIREGYYDKPLVTGNGRWLVVTRYHEEIGRQLVRINLQTNKEFVINFEEQPLVETVAFVPSLNKILMFGGGYSEYEGEAEPDYSEREGEFYFLDPETGVMQRAKGEVRPLAQQTYRPLQPTGKPDEFWAAIPGTAENTQVGVYNMKTLAFKPIVKIPEISFNSVQMWIDAGKIYFVYQGHLLGLPFPKEAAMPPAE